MTYDTTPHRVFKIGELARLIANQLILISLENVLNLACVCWHLEEPALNTLWEAQESLYTLLKVLPQGTWYIEDGKVPYEPVFRIVEDPPPEAWKRVRRYASWMQRVSLDEQSALGEDTIRQMRLNSPTGEWFPVLQSLSWSITESNLPSADLFFSPHSPISTLRLWCDRRVPYDILPTAASKISRLPASALQLLHMNINGEIPWAHFTAPLSAFVLRCGPSLTDLSSSIPLSDAAMNHLIQLPHLHSWAIGGPPPNYSTSPLPLVFPPLTEFILFGSVTHRWFPLLKRLECCIPTTRGAAPLHMVKESLRSLTAEDFHDTVIDASFSSTVQMFRNLARLNVPYCCFPNGEDRCTFKLNDDNVTELVTALPRLKDIILGRPCSENTCATTVACLLSISVRCVELQGLTIHFNTTKVVDDLKNISEGPRFRELRSLPRCTLWRLKVFQIPLALDEPGFEAVTVGMVNIFPSLKRCEGFDEGWRELNKKLKEM